MAHTLIGIVSSDKRDKTITVSITNRETHPLYRKQYTKTRKYTAHDEKNEAKLGDKVEITSCRPLSKTKTYKLVKIIERYHGSVEPKDDVLELPVEVKAEGSEVAPSEAHEPSEVGKPHDQDKQTKSKKSQPNTKEDKK